MKHEMIFSCCYEAPSNIALVKYWGKRDVQIPMNPSLSFSLSKAKTKVSLEVYPRNASKDWISLNFFENGSFQKKEKFQARIEKYFHLLIREGHTINLENYSFIIHSENTFPHSSGIASSASFFGALALCIADFEKQEGARLESKKRASFLARLGSGSAARSVYGGFCLWGQTPVLKNSSNEYACEISREDIHENFQQLCDTIAVVSKEEKAVSSSLGHQLMEGCPYREQRQQVANQNCEKLLHILKEGNWDQFALLVEEEAMNLHAMMMVSRPSFILLRPSTLTLIEAIKKWRKENNIPITFTLDAGPNLHILYPLKFQKTFLDFFNKKLRNECEDDFFIHDQIGLGPHCHSIHTSKEGRC